MGQDLCGTHHRGVVVQWLPLPLEDRARDRARHLVTHGDELRHDLPWLEAPGQSHPAGRAEIAGHCAAGLAGEANREAAFDFERNAYGFCERPVVEPKEVLHEPVARILEIGRASSRETSAI